MCFVINVTGGHIINNYDRDTTSVLLLAHICYKFLK